MKDGICRVFGHLVKQLGQTLCLGWKFFGASSIASVKIYAIKNFVSRGVFDEEGVSGETVDEPWLGSYVAGVEDCILCIFEHFIDCSVSLNQKVK